MTFSNRLAKVERALLPSPIVVEFQMCHLAGLPGGCNAPATLPLEEHEAWHRSREEHSFTFDIRATGSAARCYDDEP